MANDEPNSEQLLARWHGIGSKDRKGIMEALPIERRHQLQVLLGETADAENAAGRQYFVYSGWLASLVEVCTQDGVIGPDAITLKAPVRAAIRDAHLNIVPSNASVNMSWNFANRWRKSLADWVAGL